MKATGIVRRIDDLGRVVIPKEIRRTLKIRESEPLEIFTDRNGEIILKKYSPIGEITTSAQQLAEAASKTCGKLFCICDQDQVIAASGPESKKYQGKQLSKDMEKRLFDPGFFPGRLCLLSCHRRRYAHGTDHCSRDQFRGFHRSRLLSQHETHQFPGGSRTESSRYGSPLSGTHHGTLNATDCYSKKMAVCQPISCTYRHFFIA